MITFIPPSAPQVRPDGAERLAHDNGLAYVNSYVSEILSKDSISELKKRHGQYTSENYSLAVKVIREIESIALANSQRGEDIGVETTLVFGTLRDKLKALAHLVSEDRCTLYARADIFRSCCEEYSPEQFCS